MYGEDGQKFMDKINKNFFIDISYEEQPCKVQMNMQMKMEDDKYKTIFTARIEFDDGRILNIEDEI